MVKHRYTMAGMLFVWLLMGGSVVAQVTMNIQHQSPTAIERGTAVDLEFQLPALSVNQIQDAILYYRYGGETSYRQQNARFSQGVFTASIRPEDESATSLEYYFTVELTGGERISYPADAPESGEPVMVDIVEAGDQTEVVSDPIEGLDFTILSPQPGELLANDDVMLSITLFYEEGVIDTSNSSFEFVFDGEDVTGKSYASNYFFSYSPEKVGSDRHTVALRLNTGDQQKVIAEWNFSTVDPNSRILAEETGEQPWIPTGQVELSARNQVIAGDNNDALRGNVRLSGGKDDIRYTAYGLLTTQESSRLQPQNRYGAELYVGEWLELQGGHIYPTLSRLTIAGRRVQGVNAGVHLLNSGINLQFMAGQVNRSISNLYQTINTDVRLFNGTPVDTSYTLSFQEGGVGTHQREIYGGRLGFGRGQPVEWGLSVMKVEDDTASINSISNFNDLTQIEPSLASSLTQSQRNDLANNPNKLNVDGNPIPQGNLVTGTDLKVNLFDNKVRFRSEGAISLLNEDISNGPLTSDNDLGLDIDSDVEDLLDQLSWLIVINENMSTLPFRFDVQGDETEVDPFFPVGILASESELSLNYFDNNFRLHYRWIGPDYRSLGNSTIRRDVAGITATDRFRLMKNRLYVTLGFESLQDNLTGVKDATTDTRTLRSNFSWYPISRDLPRVSLGLMYRNRDNGVTRVNPFVGSSLDAVAVRNFTITSGDTLVTANPKLTNTFQISTSVSQQFDLFDITHDASLGFSVLSTNDDFFRFGDTNNNSLSLNVTSRLRTLPLNTHVGISINNTETLGGLSESDIFGVNVGGTLFLMDDQLQVNGTLAFTNNNITSTQLAINDNGTPNSNDDFYEAAVDAQGNDVIDRFKTNLYIFRAGAQYTLSENHAFVVDMNFTNVNDQLGSINSSNDRILQARYIYSF